MINGRRRRCLTAATVLLLVGANSCSGSDTDTRPSVEVDGIVVTGAWTRPTPPGAVEAAFYLEIENQDAPDDRLLGGQSNRCLTVAAHRTTIDANDVSTMTTAGDDDLALPRGGSVALQPNGLHLMCTGLDAPIEAGDVIELALVFEQHGPIALTVEVDNRL